MASQRGRVPKPTAIKQLEGNPGKRPLNENEPKPPEITKFPDPPEALGEYGSAEWSRTGPILANMGLLTEVDMLAFMAYCMNVQVMIEAYEDIRRNGNTIMGSRGRVRNPAGPAFASATQAVRSFVQEFGMTPSSRSRIHLPGEDDKDSLDAILGTVDVEGEDAS